MRVPSADTCLTSLEDKMLTHRCTKGRGGGGEEYHNKHFFYSFETLFLPAPFVFSSWLPNPLGIFLKTFADNFFPHMSDIRYDTYSIHEVTLLLNTKNVSSDPHHEKIRACQEQEQNILSQFAYLECQKRNAISELFR